MIRRRAFLAASAAMAAVPLRACSDATGNPQILDTMKRATRFMVEKLSYRGGYLWAYLPDRSRVWGELEAYPTMVWVQPPGTATMGHLYLDAWAATGDDYYYDAAAKAAEALIAGQEAEGGWNYFFDLAGPESRKRWYDTIGANAWRLEEFQHDWGNATFDDQGTSEAIRFLIRMQAARGEERFAPGLKKAVDFVFASQLDNGGWPQRWPPVADGGLHGKPDYSGYITFNDGVISDNINMLLTWYQASGDERVLPAIRRGMDVYLACQQPAPQAGWGLQYTQDFKPAGARTYEPKAMVTHTTATNVSELMEFYRLTGDAKYLARIPEALDWLESVRLPAEWQDGNRQFPTFVEIGTNRAMFVHRRGSNVVNGEYYVTYDPANAIGHYNPRRSVDIPKLRAEYEALKAMPGEEASKDSPLKKGKQPLKRIWLAEIDAGSDKNSSADGKDAATLASELNAEGWWPTQIKSISHPYRGPGPKEPVPGDFRSTDVGDSSDTSPYDVEDGPIAISTGTYINHMITLIKALQDDK